MKNQRVAFFLALAILAYAIWNSVDLFRSWWNSPYERLSFIVFFVWLIPVLLYWSLQSIKSTQDQLFHPFLLWAAIIVTFFGDIISLNFLQYFGFAIAIAAFLPFSLKLFPWIFSSVAWMPAFGWLGSHYFPNYVFFVRLIVVAVTSGWAFLVIAKRRD